MLKHKLIFLTITIICLISTACGQSSLDIHNVVNSLEDSSLYDCTETNFQSLNAIAGLSCLVDQENIEQSIEIYTFEKSSSDECLNTGICHLMKDQSGTKKFLSFEKNVLFITYDDIDGKLGKTLIKDLRNGENSSSNTKITQENESIHPDTISKVQSNKANIDLLIDWSNSMITFSNDQNQRIQKLQVEIHSLKTEIETLNH